jgi:hypothetical protein
MPAADSTTATICVSRFVHCAAHEFAFLVQIFAHVVELFDDGIDSLTESGARRALSAALSS